jgi:tetratricopeptide (TPR) repeat protein
VIEIPGYKILRQLGRGGMATVYLAMQESVQREVALKVMSPTLLADPDFGERFLREARIAAKLHHRHVVAIHDVSRAGDYNYIAMEYIGGEPLLAMDGTPRVPTFALKVVREIATALHYAHSKGFVHRDVKPDNILLREDGSSALADFGIARASDASTHVTRTGTVIGTPHYMSPEQARGRTLDGRADLYSLGIVLYELLLGRVPFHAEDSLAVGIMHITQPVPMLPEPLGALQPLLSRMLAKQPEERFQNGQILADTIEQLEFQIAQGAHAELSMLREPMHRQPGDDATRAMPITPLVGASRMRADPSLGRMDDIAAAPSRRAKPAKRSSAGLWIGAVIAIVIVAAGVVAYMYQNRLRSMLPRTELNSLLARGDKALSDGRLTGTQNDSARELYTAARAIDPDNDQAREGLKNVGARLVERANTEIARGEIPIARTDLAEANDVLGGGPEIDELRSRLRGAETRGTKTSDLIDRAAQALAANKLVGPASAADLYSQVLQVDSANGIALKGLNDVAKALAQQARDAITSGDIDAANQHINDLAALNPNNAAIPDLRAAIASHRPDTQTRTDTGPSVAQLMTRAEAAQRANNFTGNDGAIALYQNVLRQNADDHRARGALRKIAQTMIGQANNAMDVDNVAQADKLLAQAESAAADAPELLPAKKRLHELHEGIDIDNKQQAQVTSVDQARIGPMLQQADHAMDIGDLNHTPGDSAFDKYRAVLSIDGNNAKALAGLQRIPARAKELFEESMKNGTPGKARDYVEAVSQSDPNDAALPAMRDRLANAYLDRAESSIGEHRVNDAASALKAARQLNPGNARLPSLEARLQSSSG